MSKKMKWLSLVVALFMLITAATPVFAQSETDPLEDPPEVEGTNTFLDNPIVKLLSDFFGGLFVSEESEEPVDTGDGTDDGTGDGTGDGTDDGEGSDPTEEPGTDGEGGEETPEPTPVPTLAPDEQVAALHSDEDLGFGEITKLMQIVTEAEETCASEGVNCDVTLDGLIDEYKNGTGMGDLFKTYGKPEITGVGQVKKELDDTEETEVKAEKTNNGNAKGKSKNK